MPLTALELLRLRIADRARQVLHENLGTGDGLSLGFQTQFAPVVAGSDSLVLIADNLTTVLTGAEYQIDYALGVVRLNVAPAVGDIVQMSYQWTVFADNELLGILEVCGDDGRLAAITCLEMLLADAERFIKYTLGQEQVDRAQARQAVLDTLEQLRKYQGGPVAVVLADTVARECLLFPFVEQECDD